jgi:hypothetical protein
VFKKCRIQEQEREQFFSPYFSYFDFLRTTNIESSCFRWVMTSFGLETRPSVIYRQSNICFRLKKVENVTHWRSTELMGGDPQDSFFK